MKPSNGIGKEPVPIGRPTTRHEKESAIFSGGVRPRNTLNRQNPASTHFPQSTQNRSSTSRPTALQTEIKRGANVKVVEPYVDLTSQNDEGHDVKRRKVDNVTPNDSPTSETDLTECHSARNLEITASRSNAPPFWQPSAANSTRRLNRSQDVVCEYRNVENTMNSNPSKRQKKQHRSNAYSAGHEDKSKSTSPLLDAVSRPQSKPPTIDITVETDELQAPNLDLKPKAPYAGTARSNRSGAFFRLQDGGKRQDGNRKSPYFDQSSASVARHKRHPSPQKSESKNLEGKTNPGLNDSFIASNGEHRGRTSPTGNSSSPDELNSGTTVGHRSMSSRLSPSKDVRAQHLTKESKSRQKSPMFVEVEDDRGLASGDIPCAPFARKAVQSRQDHLQEADPPLAFELRSCSIRKSPGCHESDDLGLVYDEKKRRFEIHESGKPMNEILEVPYLYPDKVHKVFWEMGGGGRRIRLESARIGSQDNILHVELRSARDMARFTDELQDGRGPMKIMGQDSVRMENYFRNKRDQPRPRRHGIQHVDGHPEQELTTGSIATDEYQPRTELMSSLCQKLGRHSNVEKPTNSDDLQSSKEDDKTRISALLDDLRPQAGSADRSRHLRRSTRKSEIPPHLQDALFEDLNEADVPKFSKTQGLGKAWKKSLTYPKTGKKRATVDFADLERLDEGEMLNDSLVAFQMRYLEHSLEQTRPEIAKRIYFFSTFFYERLTDLPRGQKEINYAAVQKWTRNVDLFGYDYVVVPVNQNFHWYLAIICNLPAIDREFPTEEDASSSTDKEAGTSSPLTSREFDKAGDRQLGDEKAASEEAVEKGARQSFAEMDLAKDEDVEPKDEEMLDDQTGFSNLADDGNADAPQMIEGQQDKESGDPDTVTAIASNSPGPTRKQKKRKSMPPVTRVDPESPLIITLDSLGGAHGNTIKHLKQYLMKECQTRRGGTSFDPTSIKGINAKEIPQQNNFADCGIFMLGYLEMFMNGDPRDFITKTVRWGHTKQDWSELVPSKMRSDMRERLLKLGDSQEDENRTTKKERRSSTTTPHASDPTTPTEPHQAGVDLTKTSSKPSSSRNSPSRLPQPSTRSEALETAQPIGPTLANGDESRSNRPPDDKDEIINANETSQDEPSLVVIENPNKDQEDMEQPSSQLVTEEVTGPITQRAMDLPPSPKLPSQVADSQDPPPIRQEDPPAKDESQELPMMMANPAVVIPSPSKRQEPATSMVTPAITEIIEKRHVRDFGHLQRSTPRSPPNVEDDRDFAPLPVSEKRRLKQYHHKKGQLQGRQGHEHVTPVIID